MRHWIWILLALLFASTADAASTGVRITGGGLGVAAPPPFVGSSCTDGVDCFCDLAPTNVFCEDFEAAEYYEYTATGNFIDHVGAGFTCYRGGASEWLTNYPGQNAGLFANGEPASPRLGCACNAGGLQCAAKEYCSAAQGFLADGGGADCWQGNSGASIDIQRAGDFQYEIGALTLTGGTGAAADVGSGDQHLAQRVASGSVSGKTGRVAFSGGQYTEIGMTKAHAYSSNMGSISLCDDPWKHDEFESNNSDPGGYIENFGVGNTGIRGYDGSTCGAGFPYSPIMFHDGNEAACDAAAAAATVTVGSIDCNSAALRIGAGSGVYTQSTDFPFGTWACMRAHVKGMNSTNMEYRIWHGDTLIFEMTGFDGTVLKNPGYRAFEFNSYANANQGLGEDASTATGFRYVDNYIIVANGPPVSCATIGF